MIVLNSARALAQYQSSELDFKFGAGLSVDYIKPDGAPLLPSTAPSNNGRVGMKICRL